MRALASSSSRSGILSHLFLPSFLPRVKASPRSPSSPHLPSSSIISFSSLHLVPSSYFLILSQEYTLDSYSSLASLFILEKLGTRYLTFQASLASFHSGWANLSSFHSSSIFKTPATRTGKPLDFHASSLSWVPLECFASVVLLSFIPSKDICLRGSSLFCIRTNRPYSVCLRLPEVDLTNGSQLLSHPSRKAMEKKHNAVNSDPARNRPHLVTDMCRNVDLPMSAFNLDHLVSNFSVFCVCAYRLGKCFQHARDGGKLDHFFCGLQGQPFFFPCDSLAFFFPISSSLITIQFWPFRLAVTSRPAFTAQNSPFASPNASACQPTFTTTDCSEHRNPPFVCLIPFI